MIVQTEPNKDIKKQTILYYMRFVTCVAMYAIEAGVTRVIPWIRALPDRVALGSFSTELGEVNMCLYP